MNYYIGRYMPLILLEEGVRRVKRVILTCHFKSFLVIITGFQHSRLSPFASLYSGKVLKAIFSHRPLPSMRLFSTMGALSSMRSEARRRLYDATASAFDFSGHHQELFLSPLGFLPLASPISDERFRPYSHLLRSLFPSWIPTSH